MISTGPIAIARRSGLPSAYLRASAQASGALWWGLVAFALAAPPALAQQSNADSPPENQAQRPGPAEWPGPEAGPWEMPEHEAPLPQMFAIASDQSARTLGWFVQPTIKVLETATTNGSYGGLGVAKADVISDLSAGVSFIGNTPRLNIHGDYSVHALNYARGSATGSVDPTGHLDATLEAVERHLFIDTGAFSTRVLNNPFSAAPTADSTINSFAVSGEHIAPTLQGSLGPDANYRLRSDNGWTQLSPADPLRPNSYVATHTADAEQMPKPFGFAINAQRQETRFLSPGSVAFTDDSARAIFRVSPMQDVKVGLRYGFERDNYGLTEDQRRGHVAGADLSWRPTERSDLHGIYERRTFGPWWQFRLRHRMRRVAFELSSNRSTTTAPAALFSLAGGSSVQSQLDSIYSALYPDLFERARVVNNLMAVEGLPANLNTPLNVFTANITQITDHRLTLTASGRVSTLVLAAYQLRNSIVGSEVVVAPTAVANADSYVVTGASLSYSRRLTTTTTLSATGESSRTAGIGAASGFETFQNRVLLNFSESLSRHLVALLGVEHGSTRTNIFTPGQESSIYAGVSWRL